MPSRAATGTDCAAVASSSSAPSGSVRLPRDVAGHRGERRPASRRQGVDVLAGPVPDLHLRSRASSIRRTRSSDRQVDEDHLGADRQGERTDPARWLTVEPPQASATSDAPRRTGAPASTDSIAGQRDRERAPGVRARDRARLDPRGRPRQNAASSARYASRMQLGVATGGVGLDHAGGSVQCVRGRCAGVAGGHHARRAEHLAADVVAVRRGEARLGDRAIAPLSKRDHDDGGVEQAGVLEVRRDQGVGGGVDLDRLGAGVEPEQRVEVVDQGLR